MNYKVLLVAILTMGLSPFLCAGAEFFVAPTGNDGNAGTLDKPFATIGQVQRVIAPGDTVYLRGGTYAITEQQIAQKSRIYAYVHLLDKSGTKEQPIRYWAFRDERPVFDFSQVKPAGYRVHAFQVIGSWLHLKGLEVIGVQVTIKSHTQSICFANDGSHNTFEQLSMHDGQAIGVYSVRGSDNLFLNCDAYCNHDPVSEDGKGGNVDGFGGHPTKGSVNNIFRGCRAWFNSDDGFDCISAAESVTFENCWAFYNGYTPKFERLADGNGFKAGGYGSKTADQLPKPIPRHVVKECLAVQNKASGFYANHHVGGSDWLNNTAFRNGVNFNMLCRQADNKTDVPGYDHLLRNNLGYKGGRELSNFDNAKCDAKNNSFLLDLTVVDHDFVSLDESQLIAPRAATGELPKLTLLRARDDSPLRKIEPRLGRTEK